LEWVNFYLRFEIWPVIASGLGNRKKKARKGTLAIKAGFHAFPCERADKTFVVQMASGFTVSEGRKG
jgi:hypothetical protein